MNVTIADRMLEVMREHLLQAVMFGDNDILEECAEKSTHTVLMGVSEKERHKRVLDALGKSKKFRKVKIRLSGSSGRLVRSFEPANLPPLQREIGLEGIEPAKPSAPIEAIVIM